ncbi:MAG: hypothetical protein DRJ38_01620 [Thermoprotei archaeon]|nr:MAG: hypothetical protein DRJ38_01620 [Thermoprotei archaeon]
MNVAYAIYLSSFLFSLIIAFSTISILKPPTQYRASIAQLVCDICTVYRNPGSHVFGFYDFRGGEVAIGNNVILLEKRELWIFPYCGRQEDNIIYLPIEVDFPFKVSGLSCLKLENIDGKVYVSLCEVVGND